MPSTLKRSTQAHLAVAFVNRHDYQLTEYVNADGRQALADDLRHQRRSYGPDVARRNHRRLYGPLLPLV